MNVRRLVVLLSAVLLSVMAAPALAAAGWEEVRDRLVPMPPGFVETNEGDAINGKLNMSELLDATGEDLPEGLSRKDVDRLNDAGYGRTMVNAELGDMLVVMGFRANDADEAAYIVKGMLDSANTENQMQRDAAASTADVHVYSMSTAAAKGQAAVIRKGKFAYMFLVAGRYTDPHRDLAKSLATQQLDALPAGSTEVGGDGDDDDNNTAVALVIIGTLVAVVVAVVVTQAVKKSKNAASAGLLQGGDSVDQAGPVQGVGTGDAEVGSGGSDPGPGGAPANAPLGE